MIIPLRQEVRASFTFILDFGGTLKAPEGRDMEIEQRHSVSIDVTLEMPLLDSASKLSQRILKIALPLISDNFLFESLVLKRPLLQYLSANPEIEFEKELSEFKFMEEAAIYSDEGTWKNGVLS